MAIQNLGRVGIVPRGAWSGLTAYKPLDLVSYDGNSWVAKRTNTNVEPNTTNTSDWQLISNNADLVSTVQGYKNDAANSASAAAESAAAAATSASAGTSAKTAISLDYSTSSTYNTGDYAWYSGTLYRAKQDFAAAESWTSAHWEAAVVGDDIAYLNSAISDIADLTTDTVWDGITLTIQNGYYKMGNGNFVSDDWERCAVISDVTPGDVYKISTYLKSTNVAGIIYKNSSNVVISYDKVGSGTAENVTDYQFTIPANCAVLIVQSANTTAPTLSKKGTSFSAYTKDESDAKYAPVSVEDDIEDIEDVVYANDWESVSLTAEQGYYKKGNGEWTSDTTRRCAVVSGVVAGDVYRVTTHTKTTNIAGIIYKDSGGDVISYDLDGTGSDQDHVNYQFTIPTNCVTLIVQSSTTTMPVLDKQIKAFSAYTKTQSDARYAQRSTGGETVAYIETLDIKVGSDVMGTVDSSTGWTVSDGTYTHTSGNTDVLSINTSAEVGEIYLLEFDSVTPEETVRVGLGDTSPRMNIYTDSEHKNVPLKAYGNCKLYIEPIKNTYTGSISNIILRKIQDTGTEKTLTLYSVMTDNHTDNYGFYNILIGKNTVENSPGSTRTVAIGTNALRDLKAGHRNIGIGTFAMSQMTYGEANIAMGADAMLGVKQADGCVAIGKSALYNGDDVRSDVMIGCFAGHGASGNSPTSCTFIGAYAGTANRGNYNTFIGANAGYSNTTGKRNTLIGANINGQSTGDDNTCVGRMSGYPSGGSHCIALGVGAVATASGQMMLGSSNVTEVVFCGDKKINFNNDGTVTWETLT